MKRIIITTLAILLVAIGSIAAFLAIKSNNDEKSVRESFLRNYQQGYFESDEGSSHIDQIGYKKLPDGWYAIDFQFFDMPEGARGPAIIRGVLTTEFGSLKLVATLPGGKITTKSLPEVNNIPENIRKEITDWPPSPPVHKHELTAFNFYSGDLTEVSRTKLTDWFVGTTIDTRPSNMSVRKGSYSKTEDQKPAIDTHSHTHEKTFIQPAMTVSFILDVQHPKSSYKITQKAHKEAPYRDTIHLSCIDDGVGEGSKVNCGGDMKL